MKDLFTAGEGGEVGALLHAHGGAPGPLGRAEQWPVALRAQVGVMLGGAQPMLVVWGPQRLLLYNDAFARLLGHRHPEALGQPFAEVWPEVLPDVGPLMDRAFAGEPVVMDDIELIVQRHGYAEEVHLSFFLTPVREDDGGGVEGVFCACSDITDRVFAERRRAEELARQRRLFEHAPGFIAILVGPQHLFEFVNLAWLRLFGEREYLGRPVREAFGEAEGQGLHAWLDEVHETGERFVATHLALQLDEAPQGPSDPLYLDFICEPIKDAQGRVTGIFVEGRDVSDVRRATEALREADRRKDAFLATLAHELRNPLAPIRTAAHALGELELSREDLAWCREVITRQAHHMALLLDDLLDVSRITSGRLELRKDYADLRDVIQSAIETAQPLLDARRHDLQLLLPPEPVELEVDLLRLSQVLSNLLTNAAKYTDPGGRIALRVARDEGGLRIAVQDNGIGLSPDALPRVFEMFSQVRSAVDRTEGGLGIGLALSKGLVELHGGALHASSAGLGRGTTFTVHLPPSCLSPVRRVASQADDMPTRVAARPLRILVADDNRDAAESLALLLRFEGHDVHMADTGGAALRMAQALRPEVAILDIGMPEVNGYEVARRLRLEAWGRETFLLAVTGWGQEDAQRLAAAAGFDRHLVKPVDPVQLVAVVQQWGASRRPGPAVRPVRSSLPA